MKIDYSIPTLTVQGNTAVFAFSEHYYAAYRDLKDTIKELIQSKGGVIYGI